MSSYSFGDADPYAAYAPSASSPSAGQAGPSASITVAPGYTPDYASLLQSDPSLAAARNAADASQQGADAARRTAVRTQYVNYGGDLPAGWTDKYGDIDQATKDAATGNQFSTIAQMRDNYAKSVEGFKRALAARGALQSSELGYGQDQLDRGMGQQRYDAANAFNNQLVGDYGTYAGVLGQNARDLAGAVGTAQGNAFNNPANRPVAPTVARYDAASSAKYGKPVYTDEWGTVYDQYGNVLVQGTPPPAPAPTGGGTPDQIVAAQDPGGVDTSTGGEFPNEAGAIQDAAAVQYASQYQGAPVFSLASTDRALASAYQPPVSGYDQRSRANLH